MAKSRKVQEMADEYRLDYSQANPNHFASKTNLNVGWTVEKFVEGEKKEGRKRSNFLLI